MVPRDARRILDVGCSNGVLGASLRSPHSEVWGIEYNAAFAEEAASRLDHIIHGDAATALRQLVTAQPFDAVICADILEHLPDPSDALLSIRQLVTPNGCCIVSIPNVRFYTTFVELGLRGTWPRRDRGVHGHTHLHWFTDRDVRRLFAEYGFIVEDARPQFRLVDSPLSRWNRFAKIIAKGPLRPFLAYQLLYRVRIEHAEAYGDSR